MCNKLLQRLKNEYKSKLTIVLNEVVQFEVLSHFDNRDIDHYVKFLFHAECPIYKVAEFDFDLSQFCGQILMWLI